MRQRGEPVNNQSPACQPVGPARIAIVGECPGRDEDWQGAPFVGESGRILSSGLEHIGLTRSQMLVGNVCQSFPGEGRDFNSFAWEGEAVQAGVAQLRQDLEAFNPTMVLCLGNAALHLMKHGNVAPPKRGGAFDWPSKVGDWRGSLFESPWLQFECWNCHGHNERYSSAHCGFCDCKGVIGVKTLATYHPAAVAREQSLQAYWRCAPGVGDLERLKVEAGTRELVLPRRDIMVHLPDYGLEGIQHFLGFHREDKKPVSIDIEGNPGNVTSIAFSRTACCADVIPLAHIDGTSVWREDDEVAIWQAVKELLEDEQVVKIGQNFSYDSFALAWTYGITTRGMVWDTMELMWELWPELDKGLDVQASLLTLQQFYKPDKHREDGKVKLVFASDEEFYCYNGLDACVTFECWQREVELLRKRAASQQQAFAAGACPHESGIPKSDGPVLQCATPSHALSAAASTALVGAGNPAGPVPDADWARTKPSSQPLGPAPTCLTHAAFNSSLFAPAKLYPMLRGIKVDLERVEEEKAKAALGVWELQAEINHEAAKLLGPGTTTLYDLHANFASGSASEEWFAWLCLSCLGGKNPRQRVEVVEKRWQPMRWKGKRWVKAGKLLLQRPAPYEFIEQDTEPAQSSDPWLKPMPRTVSRLQPFTPVTLAEVEPHLLKEGQAVWKRVKQIWKELKHETTTGKDSSSQESTDGSKRAALSDRAVNSLPSRSARLGELSTLLGLAVNIGSTGEGGDAQWFLYEVCGLPRIYKDERTGKYSRESESEWKKRTKEGVRHEQRRKNGDGGSNAGSDDAEDRQPAREGESAGTMGEPAVSVRRPSKRPSTDQQALDKLYAATQDVRVLWALQQRRLRMVVSDLSKEFDDDGRVRSSISLVKETGRMAASKSPLGTGTNLMALNRDLLRICVADEGCELGKFDLEGADSWTVAAECAALGDPTMLLDLKAGLKPAKVLCFIFQEGPTTWDRDTLAEAIKLCTFPPWLYPAAKSTIHGYCYGSGWETTRDTILKYSMADLPLELGEAKPIVLSKAEVEKLRAAAASRYPGIKLWHAAEGREMLEKGYLDMSTGHRRLFFGRKAEWKQGHKQPNHDTLKEWLASKPQYYTTLVVKKALWKLWYDEANRRACGTCGNKGGVDSGGSNPDGSWIVLPCPNCDSKAGCRLRIEPLMARHDELLVQWRVEDRAWALEKMRGYFNTELLIAGQRIVIPAEGKVGQSWAMK